MIDAWTACGRRAICAAMPVALCLHAFAQCEFAKLLPDDGASSDHFGSVSIDADRVVVGAYWNDGVAFNSGSAYVFVRDDNGTPEDPSDDFWIEEDKLLAGDGGPGDWFGGTVSSASDCIAVGAHAHSHDGLVSGSAYLFQRDDNGTPDDPSDDFWVQESKLLASDGEWGDAFGHAVSISVQTAAIGSPGDDDLGPSSGSAYVFDLAGADCNENGICDGRDIAEGTSEDENENGIPDECECAGDLDNDGDTDQADLGILLSDWGCVP